MEFLEFHVKDSKSAEEFARKVNGFEAKSVYLESKDYHLSFRWNLAAARCRRSKVKRWYWHLRHRLWRLFKAATCGYHHRFMTYNAEAQIDAYIYKPWTLVLRDDHGYITVREGDLEKIYSKLEVSVDHETKYIWVTVPREW